MSRLTSTIHRWSRDQWLRGRHLLEWLRGRELWLRPEIRCRKLSLGQGGGQWCVCPEAIRHGGVAYTVGVGEDISFDLELVGRCGLEVHAFDPTPLSAQWLARQTTPEQFHFHPWGLAGYDGQAEFSLPLSHGVSFTTLKAIQSKMSARGEVRRLKSIMDTLGHERLEILKMDIEGAEYEVIPDIVDLANQIGQVLIEFHHRLLPVSNGLQRTKQALEALGRAGFRIFYVSPFGLEYSLLRVGADKR